jgi:organic hydroperoxide reductase OsmC/OhrA
MSARDDAAAPASTSKGHISRRYGFKLVAAGMAAAEQNCPISRVLRAEIALDAKLV